MLLNKEKIILNLSMASHAVLGEVVCFEQLDSTNRWLVEQAQSKNIHNHVCIADSQTAGIGRSGKAWISSDSKNILMSIAHQFGMSLSRLSGLSLVVGIAVVHALEELGVDNLSLKWPNDVYLNDAKLAGILIQTLKHPLAGYWAVVGIGLNVELTVEEKNQIPQLTAELSEFDLGVEKREIIIAKVLDQLFIVFEQFSKHGLGYFQDQWKWLDYLKNKSVVLNQNGQRITGQYLGINQDGALRIVLPNKQVKEYYVGELSVRKSAAQ